MFWMTRPLCLRLIYHSPQKHIRKIPPLIDYVVISKDYLRELLIYGKREPRFTNQLCAASTIDAGNVLGGGLCIRSVEWSVLSLLRSSCLSWQRSDRNGKTLNLSPSQEVVLNNRWLSVQEYWLMKKNELVRCNSGCLSSDLVYLFGGDREGSSLNGNGSEYHLPCSACFLPVHVDHFYWLR